MLHLANGNKPFLRYTVSVFGLSPRARLPGIGGGALLAWQCGTKGGATLPGGEWG